MALELDLWLLLFIPLLIILIIIVNRKFHPYDLWITAIKKFAPLFLIFFPAFITYFIVCGTLSATAVGIYSLVRGKDNFNGDEFLFIEKCVEYACGFGMLLVYFRILSKQNFPSFWAIIITLVHMLVAGYRDAKLIYLTPKPGNDSHFESGPMILQNIQWLDAVIPLLSFLLFYFVFRKKWQAHAIENIESGESKH